MQYAIEKVTDKRIAAAEALYTRDGGNYCCEICGQRVHKRILNQQPFFYHDGDAEMYCTKDTWEIEEPTRWHTRMQKRIQQDIPTAQPEKYLKHDDEVHRADIFIPLTKHNLVIELQSAGISIDNVQKRNYFYTTNGDMCLWILNTAKLCANGEIRTTKCSKKSRTIITSSPLLRNVTFGRTTPRSFVCIQQNEDMFALVLSTEEEIDENGMRTYTVSSSYTWHELIEMIYADMPVSQILIDVPSVDTLQYEDKMRNSAVRKNASTWATRTLSNIQNAQDLQTFVSKNAEYCSTDYNLIPLILNHHCICQPENRATWTAIACLLLENGTRRTAALIAPYLDEEEHVAEIDWMVQTHGPHYQSCTAGVESILWYYVAKKSQAPSVLLSLVSHTNEQVRIAVCLNVNAPLAAIAELSQDRDEAVQRVAQRVLSKDEHTTLLAKLYHAEKENAHLQQTVQQLEQKLQAAETQITTMQESLEEQSQIQHKALAESEAAHKDMKAVQRSLEMVEHQLKIYHSQKRQNRDWLATEHAWHEWETYLAASNTPGVFIFLLPNGRYGQELRWVSVDNGEVIPMHTLEYYRSDKTTRTSYKWKSSYLPPKNTVCRLIGYREACKLFGPKYVNASVWKND